jgi:hypothetical protein
VTGVERIGPLSFAQQEMLGRLQRFADTAGWYDWFCLYEIEGRLDPSALRGALDDLVRRHDVLRTTVGVSGSNVVQRVHDGPVTELAQLTVSDELTAIIDERLASRHGAREILAGAPLFRSELLSLGAGRHLLILRLHHLIYDGLSVRLIFRDLGELYASRLHGRAPSLPLLSATYLDFAERQIGMWPEIADEATRFWTGMTSGVPLEVNWPGGARVPNYEFRIATGDLVIAQAAVRDAARAARVSPFLVLLAATAAAIGRVTARSPLLLGTDVTNRDAPFKQNLVGLYLNTRVSRAAPEPGRPLVDVVREIREQWLDAEEHIDAYIAQALPSASSGQLVQVVMEPPDIIASLDLPQMAVRPVPVTCQWRHWRELIVSWLAGPDGYSVQFMYRPSVVTEPVIAAISEHLGALLADPATATC